METTTATHSRNHEPKWAIDGVPSASVGDVWPTVWPIIKEAVDVTPEAVRFTEEQILNMLINREMQLWVIMNLPRERICAAAITSLINVDEFIPDAMALEVPFVAGRGMNDWIRALNKLLGEYGRIMGAQYLFGYGRKGWERMAGFKNIGYTKSGIRVMAQVIKRTH